MRSRLLVFTTVFLLVLGLEYLLYKGGFPEDCMPDFTRFRTALVLAFGLTWLCIERRSTRS
jgi:uncharacterized protein YhhL (DUF1145 family)